jgi:hypothetical protein
MDPATDEANMDAKGPCNGNSGAGGDVMAKDNNGHLPEKNDGKDGHKEDRHDGESNDGSDCNAEIGPGSKFYKTTLCQFYLAGPCKNGDTCNFAHGTSELRTPQGDSVKDVGGNKKVKLKTKLCEKFLQFGDCPFGMSCNYAHGVRELQKAAAATSNTTGGDAGGESDNPSFKTALCKSYMAGMYCHFGQRCQYAHGRHELREKAQLKPDELDEETRKKLKEKNSQRPDYKTKLCKNFEQNGSCEFQELCNFAHGQEELKPAPEKPAVGAAGSDQTSNSHYKTKLCKNGSSCTFGSACKFAHSADELRSAPAGGTPSLGYGSSGYGNYFGAYGYPSYGPYSYAAYNSSGYGGAPGSTGSAASGTGASAGTPSSYKTVLCKNYTEGQKCRFGTSCQFAHGQHELRKPGAQATISGAPVPSGMPPAAAAAAAAAAATAASTNSKGKFKTVCN